MAIATRRFLLRDFTPQDAESFVAYQADLRQAGLAGPGPLPPVEARRLLAEFARWAAERPRRHHQFAVVRRDDPRVLVGCAGLRHAPGAAGAVAELGIELAPDHRGGHGYAVEIARALLEFGFGALGLDAVRGVTTDANLRAERLARWFGARLVATRRGPGWVAARGWRETEWEVAQAAWLARDAAEERRGPDPVPRRQPGHRRTS